MTLQAFDLGAVQRVFTLNLAHLYATQAFEGIPKNGEGTLLPVRSAVQLWTVVSDEVRVSASHGERLQCLIPLHILLASIFI